MDSTKESKFAFLEELECPICTDYLTLPIRECSQGHSICGKCIERLEKCPLCRAPITDTRNLTLEALAQKIRYPCVNRESGCTQLLTYEEREQHELSCNTQGLKFGCQMKNCNFSGDLASLKNHWMSKQDTNRLYGPFNKCVLKIKPVSYYVNLIEAFNQLFWYKMKIQNKLIYFTVQFIGKLDEAHKFFYQIEITHEAFYKKRILLSDYCKSLSLSDEELFKEDICSVLTIGSLGQFLQEEGADTKLKYTMKLYKVGFNPGNRKRYNAKKNYQRKPQKHRSMESLLSIEVQRQDQNNFVRSAQFVPSQQNPQDRYLRMSGSQHLESSNLAISTSTIQAVRNQNPPSTDFE